MSRFLYFAYGSNLNFEQMKDRCPDSKYLGTAKLNGYKFVYDGHSKSRKGPVANIIASENDYVLGGVFEISEKDLVELDKREGYPISYQKEKLLVENENDERISVLVYKRAPLIQGIPTKEYRNIILEGAKNCNLPEIYVRKYI